MARVDEINRLYEELEELEPGSDEYDKILDELNKMERMTLEETKIENAYTVDSWKQLGEENRAKRENVKFWVQTGFGLVVAGLTLFASETRVMCRDIANNVGTALKRWF